MKQTLSRRSFIATAASLGTAALLGRHGRAVAADPVLDPSPPLPGPYRDPSPGLPGPYRTDRVILGEDEPATTYALRQYFEFDKRPGFPAYFVGQQNQCADGTLVGPRLPSKIVAAVYYPAAAGRPDFPRRGLAPVPIAKGPFPVLLYAHAYRDPLGTACGGSHPATRDFTAVEAMLRHVASYGCVAVAPDLSWLPGGLAPDTVEYGNYAIATRADVLISYYRHLAVSLNAVLFDRQLDLSRLVVAGHSTGAPAAVMAGRVLTASTQFQSLSFALIAPMPLYYFYIPTRNALMLKGTFDTLQIPPPEPTYGVCGRPKTLVTIPGANHFGYTDLCRADNRAADVGLYDNNGGIPRDAQQLAGAAYLAALMRCHAQGDATARPYLSGAKRIDELEAAGATGIQVEAEGFA